MTINQAYQFIQFCLNKAQNGYITPDQFNMLAPLNQLSLINDRIGNVKKYTPHDPTPAYGFGMNQKTRTELRPLLVKPTTTAVTSGSATIPSDLLYYDTLSANGITIKECTQDELDELINNPNTPPTVSFPKFVMQDKFYIYPTSITSIKISYLRRPSTPVWGYTPVNDEPVYDAGTSQDFETADSTHYEICSRILAAVGLNLSVPEITQVASAWEAQGK